MRRRVLASLSALAIVVAVASLTAVPVAAQAAAGVAAKKWTPARTPDGRPDLQGVWSFATITPLETPNELVGKAVLTEAEIAAVEAAAADRRIDRAPAQGQVGTYNQFWFDRGTKAVSTNRPSLIVDPPDGKLPPYTPRGQKTLTDRLAALDRNATPEDRMLGERCILGFNSGPPMTPDAYNNLVQLFQVPGYVVILNEMVHSARIVPMDGRPHGNIRQWMGDSRGRWEGDTLVIETRNFTEHGVGHLNQRLRPTDENLHVIERFTRVDADTLMYESTVNDPTAWTKPWAVAIPMEKSQDLLFEYACHEGNYAMAGILSGARAAERAADAKKKSSN